MPAAIAITRHQGLEALDLRSPDGARAVLTLHGAHIVSWQPAGAGEQLYVSPKTAYANGQAIRGGVPVCFPQFAERGPLPKHGFARTRPWQLVSAEQSEMDALAVLRLTDDAATRLIWPHAFEAELSVLLHGRTLQIELAVENKGDAPFDFTTALHTYLAVNDIDEASVAGLSGLQYFDSVDKTEKQQRVELLLPSGELDRIYYQATEPLELREQGISTQRQLQISQQGFEDVVTWNPGAERCAALADMPADGWRKMLCLEAATVRHPVLLAPGESWVGMQSLVLA